MTTARCHSPVAIFFDAPILTAMKLAAPVFALAFSLAWTANAADPTTPFNGKNLSNWEMKQKPDKGGNKWVTGEPRMSLDDPKLLSVTGNEGAMVNLAARHGESWDIYSKQKWGSARIELDVMVPKGSNSGVYVMGEYEVQVFDSYGKEKPGAGDMGAVYGANPPPVNASKPPGAWQRYVIEYRAPQFDASGTKTANMKFIKIELNGQVLHQNLEMKGPTPSGVTGREAAEGPIMFQGDHGPVAYRNIRITPLP